MKTQFVLILSGFLVSCGSAFSQQPANLPTPTYFTRQQQTAGSDVSLTRFDLVFPGGTPEQLVRAIEKASGKPLNAIVPSEHADVQLPPLRMKSVIVPALFQALEMASAKTELVATGTYDYGLGTGVGLGQRTQYSQFASSYGFQTLGPPGDDSVWYFFYRTQPRVEVPKTCRIYHLAPYLENYKVEDITTAIQTGWKMLGEKNPPTVSYHKDTKLLIAVGEAYLLQLIDEVLRQLSDKKKPEVAGFAPAKSGEAAKPNAEKEPK